MESTGRIWLRSAPVIALPFLVLFAITQQSEIPWHYFFLDLPIALRVPIFTCAVTGVTSMLWCSSGAIALFGSSLCCGSDRKSLILWGSLSLMLGLDDFFMIHENLLSNFLGLTGKGEGLMVESAIFLTYGFVLLVWIIAFGRTVPGAIRPFLALALVCFAASLTADLASSYKIYGRWSRFGNDFDFQLLVEDGPKFIGVAFWAVFTWHYSRSRMQARSSSVDAN